MYVEETDPRDGQAQPRLKSQMLGIEAMDHPTDGALLDHARRFFKTADKMKPREA